MRQKREDLSLNCLSLASSQRGGHLGDFCGCRRMRQRPRAFCHLLQARGVSQQVTDRFYQPLAAELRLGNHHRRTLALHGAGVARLVIVGSAREWDKNRWLAGGGDFAHGARSGAAEQQIGLGEGGGHVVNERADFGWNPGTQISSLGLLIIALPGLMNQTQIGYRRPQSRQGINHRAINCRRSLTATENQQGRRAARRAEQGPKKFWPYRHASDSRVAKVAACLFKVNGGGRNQPRHQSIGAPGYKVWL